jgi:hypothetical protein
LGLIRAYFPSSDKLKEITHRIYHFKIIKIEKPPFDLNDEQLESWRVNYAKKVQEFVEEEYSKPIDELVTYLESIIDKEAG